MASLLIGLSCAVPTVAAEINIGGTYGNEAGCRYLADGVYGDDTVLALTPGEVQTAATLCSFVTATTLDNGAIVATVICGHEGEGYETLGLMRFARSGDGLKWGIYDADGNSWGEVPPCP